MKENVLDVLMYLFENYMDEEIINEQDSIDSNDAATNKKAAKKVANAPVKPDREALTVELQQAGFHTSEINKAIAWLEGLSDLQDAKLLDSKQSKKSFRVFSTIEKQKLNSECQGFIYFMDHIGAFDQHIREVIIDRVMALDAHEIDLEQLKWVMLLVLFNQPGHEDAFEWIEDVVFDEVSSSIH